MTTTGFQIGMLAVLILVWFLWLFRWRRFAQLLREWHEIHDQIVLRAEQVTTGMEQSHDVLVRTLWARVAAEHTHYSASSRDLPGLLTVSCEDCDEVIGTMRTDTTAPPQALVTGHVEQKFTELLDQAKAVNMKSFAARLLEGSK